MLQWFVVLCAFMLLELVDSKLVNVTIVCRLVCSNAVRASQEYEHRKQKW